MRLYYHSLVWEQEPAQHGSNATAVILRKESPSCQENTYTWETHAFAKPSSLRLYFHIKLSGCIFAKHMVKEPKSLVESSNVLLYSVGCQKVAVIIFLNTSGSSLWHQQGRSRVVHFNSADSDVSLNPSFGIQTLPIFSYSASKLLNNLMRVIPNSRTRQHRNHSQFTAHCGHLSTLSWRLQITCGNLKSNQQTNESSNKQKIITHSIWGDPTQKKTYVLEYHNAVPIQTIYFLLPKKQVPFKHRNHHLQDV